MGSDCVTDWKRTGDKNTDFLHLYQTSEMYDCSFKVGSQKKGFQIYKCHKLILATASCVFQTMLYGQFKEAKAGRDDPILLDHISPAAFNEAMRFIYGNVQDFKNFTVAIQIYRFAHEMQISKLVEAVQERLSKVGPSEVFEAMSLYAQTDNREAMEKCWEIVQSNPAKSLKSMGWLSVTPATLEMVMKKQNLLVEESTLFKALVNWGRFQVKNGDDAKVRTLIDPYLKYVGFKSMSAKEFVDLCSESKVLSTDEKLSILMGLVSEKKEVIPEKFLSDVDRMAPVVVEISYKENGYVFYSQVPQVRFKVDQAAVLIGFKIHPSVAELFSNFELRDATNRLISSGETKTTNSIQGVECINVKSPEALVCNKEYKFTFPGFTNRNQKNIYSCLSTSLTNQWLTVTLLDPTCYAVNLSHIVFTKCK